jgi:adenosylcobinamide-phosphate synthase
MDFAALLLALLIEQGRPVPHHNPVWDGMRALTHWFSKTFNAGEQQHGQTAWWLFMIGLMAVTVGIWWLAARIHPVLGFCVNVLALVFTLGFRRFSHHFTEIEKAAEAGDIDAARKALSQWRTGREQPLDVQALSMPQVMAHAIEEGLVSSHRSVFGIMFWFAVLPGPTGALLYRMGEYVARAWSSGESSGEKFGTFARQAFEVLDWVPVRLSALAFAIVGNFEDAMHLWRNRALRFGNDARAVLVSAGAGAIGVEIGPPAQPLAENKLDWSGIEPTLSAMRSGVGLVWRATVLWMTVVALWTVAQWFS